MKDKKKSKRRCSPGEIRKKKRTGYSKKINAAQPIVYLLLNYRINR